MNGAGRNAGRNLVPSFGRQVFRISPNWFEAGERLCRTYPIKYRMATSSYSGSEVVAEGVVILNAGTSLTLPGHSPFVHLLKGCMLVARC